MATLSISRAWDETKSVLARDGKLFVSVAAALILLPQVVAALFASPDGGPETASTLWIALMAVATIIALVGQLAMVRLALSSGLSVGEAIRHGFGRLLAFVASVLIMVAAILLLAIVVIAILGALGIIGMPGPDAQLAPRDAAILVTVLLVPFLFLAVRLLPTVAVASAEPIGPIAILKRSWSISRGHFWRLFGFLVLFIVAALILVVAMTLVIGTIVGLIFGNPQPFSVGALILALLLGVVQTAVTVIYIVMVSRIYAQLTAEVSVPSSGT
ncbi:MAG TPA: hypothetical protein VNH53_07540 [Sphingomicrobium sp.]|nr:hypothetical protein [Sphingomicrobium sp.]